MCSCYSPILRSHWMYIRQQHSLNCVISLKRSKLHKIHPLHHNYICCFIPFIIKKYLPLFLIFLVHGCCSFISLGIGSPIFANSEICKSKNREKIVNESFICFVCWVLFFLFLIYINIRDYYLFTTSSWTILLQREFKLNAFCNISTDDNTMQLHCLVMLLNHIL